MESKNIDELFEKDLKELKQAQEERNKNTFEEKARKQKIFSTVKELVVNVGLVASVVITLFVVEKKHFVLQKVEAPYHKKTITTSLGEEENYLQKEAFKELAYVKKCETTTKEEGVIEQKIVTYYTEDPFPFSKEEMFQMDNETLNTYFYLYNIETIETSVPQKDAKEDYTEIGAYEEDWTHTYIKNEAMTSYLPRVLLLAITDFFLLTVMTEKLYLSYQRRKQKRICDFSNTSSYEIEQMIQLTEQNKAFLTANERDRVPKLLTKGSARRR